MVDWARGGFGERSRDAADPLGVGSGGARLRPDPLGLDVPTQAPPPLAPPPPPASPAWGSPNVTTAPTPAQPAPSWASGPGAAPAAMPAQAPATPAPNWGGRAAAPPAPPMGQASIQSVEAELAAFLVGAGLQPSDLKVSGAQAMTAAGSALRRVIAGLVVMLEARARAKAQLGAQGTSLEFDGNNP